MLRLRFRYLAVSLLVATATSAQKGNSVAPMKVPLWPVQLQLAGAQPQLEIYRPLAAQSKDITVLIVPGGGYGIISPYDRVLAEFFRSEGYPAAIVDYRTLPSHYPAALADVMRAVRMVRAHGKSWNLPVDRIALLGESAGGQLAAITATQPDFYRDPNDDLAATISAKPDLLVLLYPLVSAVSPTRHGSVDRWLGTYATDRFRASISPELHVSGDAPPTILFHAADDPIVSWQNSLDLAEAYWRVGASAELHVFPHGGHGHEFAYSSAISETWRSLLLRWLEAHESR